MNINFSAWSIRKPIPAILLFVVLCVLGVISFLQLPVTRFPNIDVPLVSITVTQSGAAPAELETQVSKRVEDAVANIPGVKHLRSTLTDGQSQTIIEFRLETNTDRAVNDVKDAIAKIRADLPRTIDEPVIQRIDVEGQSILTYGAASPGMTLEQLSWHVDDVVARELQGLKGVGRVERYGGVDREIRISLDPDRLLALGITAGEVNRQVRATNVDLAGGRGEVGGQEQAIRTLAGAKTVADLAETKITLSGGREVRLKELGRVEDSSSEPRAFGRLNKSPVVSFAVFRSKGSSELSVKDVVSKRIAELNKRYPDVRIAPIDDAVAYTAGNYKAAMETLLEGAALAVIVVFLFLRNWRATLITAIALPLSAIPTFWAMQLMGFSLNLVSLLGITLVTGILVDDAIVEIENIVRHMKMGKSPYRAAMEAADEIGLAVIAITLTIVAIFAPVSFMGGVAGQYFRQFGLTVAVAVLFSLLVARLITPMMAAYLMKPVEHADPKDGRLMGAYVGLLRATLKKRRIPVFPRRDGSGWRTIPFNTAYATLIVGFLFLFGSIQATQMLPTGFIPDEDTSRVVASVELPPGATLEDTRVTTDKLVDALKTIPEVRDVFVLGGASPTGQREVRRGAVFILLKHKSERSIRQKELKVTIAEKLASVPDVRAWYVNERGEREMAFSILSKDGDALDEAVAKIEARMRQVPGYLNVATAGSLNRPELRITPKLEEAASLGVTPEAISEAVRVATLGDVGANLAKFTAGDRQVPIRVQLDEVARTDIRNIAALRVTNTSGVSIPLTAVARIGFGDGPSSIDRYDRVRRAQIGADLKRGFELGTAQDTFEEIVNEVGLPKGVWIAATGDAEIQGEVVQGFIQAMTTGLMLVLAVLILLFGSVFQPITILLSLPLSFGGVVIALLATGKPVSMPVYIGLLMLMGIVTKNAIMLVDFAVEEVARGKDRMTAVIEAGRKRARPILMTTIAMAAGMAPSAYGVGDGGEFRSPMAIAVIGGLIVSTVLSLIFVPSFYSVMDDLSRLTGRLFGRFFSPPEDESQWQPIHDPEHATPGEATAEAMGGRPPPRLAAE
ncbi:MULTISPECIES: efflux RND transporter permease subunit [unclassified Bosea (in: a-proteobacteria)]|uniref:efflux RND transporter permease subunit n=1 Tax=unclassified Bosea (in: a-proteobacteria) TaxID=2653178 RepID=UPI000956F70A|nr:MULTISPECIES: efflux RND transporter permease subunit [unclassified Bosea (in: a-proteobacteria)]TAJ28631.1 MAG: efflux RND transporter permease subunit [Bosea sp. (in: a-proteobacteria)]SIR32633.1 hydrophobe/amphiphile efflux-1 (HAE1) family protein [Bosea sp. TND4EK4]